MPIQDNLTRKLIELEEMPARVFKQAMDWAENDFQEQFDRQMWTFDTLTIRRNGQIIEPGQARDLVDLGNLKRSQRRENGVNYTVFEWTGGRGEVYAAYVHDGYTPKSRGGQRGKSVPARPWTEATIRELESVLSALLAKELR